MDNKGF